MDYHLINLQLLHECALDIRYYVEIRASLAIIISYPTSASGIIVLLKKPTKYREFFPFWFVKTTDFQLVFNFEQTGTITIFGKHGIMAQIQ